MVEEFNRETPQEEKAERADVVGVLDETDDNLSQLEIDNNLIDCESSTSASRIKTTAEVSDLTFNFNLVDGTSTTRQDDLTAFVVEEASLQEEKENENVEYEGTIVVSSAVNGRTKQLKLNSLAVIGRDEELAMIRQSFDCLLNKQNGDNKWKQQLVLISGASGTGKTHLAQSYQTLLLAEQRNSSSRGLYVRGKFDTSSCRSDSNQPYSGIASASAQICGAVQDLYRTDPQRFDEIRDLIQQHIEAEEMACLIQVIPALKEIATEGQSYVANADLDAAATADGEEKDNDGQPGVDPNTPTTPNNSSAVVNTIPTDVNSSSQLYYAFTRFLRIIANKFFPLVFVLDDLHLADASSVALLNALVSDQSNDKLLIVGIYRSNQMEEALHQFVLDMERRNQENEDFGLMKREIGELSLGAVHEIVKSILDESDQHDDTDDKGSRTLGLAKVCHEKTNGNPFFLREFVAMLCKRCLLQFDFERDLWMWDEQEIRVKTSATDNVVDLLRSKMEKLSGKYNLTLVLRLAACFGSSFQLATMKLVWRNLPGKELADDHALEDGLGMLERHNLIVANSTDFSMPKSYSWSHDKIQEAALSLFPTRSDQVAFGHKVGDILISKMKDSDSAFFVAVNLLNVDSQNTGDVKRRLALARLNYEASAKSLSLSSFENAAEYAGKGIGLLPENAWVDQSELCFQLYSTGAKAECFLGKNVDTIDSYCRQVMTQKVKQWDVKFSAYNAKIDSLCSRGKVDQAVLSLLDVLSMYKCSFPSNNLSICVRSICHIIWIKWTMKSQDLSDLSKLNDPTRLELMKLLDKLATSLYMVHDERLALVVFRSLHWTLKYGYCDYSPVAFAAIGIVLTGKLGDLQGGAKYGVMALTLLEKSNSTATAARTMFYVHALIFCWTKPAKDIIAPLLKAHEIGLRTGDTECATWAIYNRMIMKYLTGCPLPEMEAELRSYSKTMKDMKGEHAFYVCCVSGFVRQVYLNLMGRNNINDPTKLIGDASDKENLHHCENDPFLKPGAQAYRGMIMTYFGQHIEQADWTIKLGLHEFSKTNVANPEQMWESFLKGLSCFAAARETGNTKKYVKIGNTFRSRIKKWVSLGNPNVVHYASLLDAESLAVKGKTKAAIAHYEQAIALAESRGAQHDAALACERLCVYHLTVTKDSEKACFQFNKAHKHWTNWGAMAKVEDLETKLSSLRPMPSEVHVERD
ncbi:hypothetical protein ACA910_017587 [Epithemia clementina (nom. ined.)]